VPRSTIYAVLHRYGISRLKPRSAEPIVRYEWPEPGDMLHLDIKKLGRINHGGGHRAFGRGPGMHYRTKRGWDYVHVAIDDHSRLAYAEVCADETSASAVAFTERAVDFFEEAGIATRRILTDNGAAYRSHAFRDLLGDRAIAMRKTRPYRPQTNGKAEAFIKILTNEWAYGATYLSNEERTEALDQFLTYYNLSRPHGGIDGQTPISRVM
jgi:transposase InsO family protein